MASIARYIMDILYGDGPLRVYEDDYRRMRSLNDLNQDKLVDLSTIGLVDLDTSISPDVFSLRTFDSRKPVDSTEGPMGFHDIILGDLTRYTGFPCQADCT